MDAVLITTLNNNHTFTWQSPSREDETGYRPVAEHFIFVDEIDYQPLYVYFAENDLPQEVAVYVNNVCKGAQVVEDTICQICAYILEEEAGEEIEFVFYYNERSEIQRCCKYSVYDRNTNRFESQSLLTGTPGIHYEVRFDQHKQDIPGIEDNLYCYPNPFNPELSICFNIKNTEHIKLEVYNTRGQMVKSLIAETCRPGDYHVIWKGDNNSGNKVCSGIYYIRLQTGDKVETSKALLLK